jgi:hypothetical protein
MNWRVRMANRHLVRTLKAVDGRSDVAAQEEARGSVRHLREWLSDDPEVLQLARPGYEAFVVRTGERETTMTTEPICSREEAREQLKRLEHFYGVPDLPVSRQNAVRRECP